MLPISHNAIAPWALVHCLCWWPGCMSMDAPSMNPDDGQVPRNYQLRQECWQKLKWIITYSCNGATIDFAWHKEFNQVLCKTFVIYTSCLHLVEISVIIGRLLWYYDVVYILSNDRNCWILSLSMVYQWYPIMSWMIYGKKSCKWYCQTCLTINNYFGLKLLSCYIIWS